MYIYMYTNSQTSQHHLQNMISTINCLNLNPKA